MIRAALAGLALCALAACDRQAPSGNPAATDRPSVDRHDLDFEATAARLAADRSQLDAARAACKADAPEATPQFCEAVAEANRRRFRGRGGDYQPHEVGAFPTAPAIAESKGGPRPTGAATR